MFKFTFSTILATTALIAQVSLKLTLFAEHQLLTSNRLFEI